MMTIDWRKYCWQPGFVAGFFAVGVPYWLIPYNAINLPDAVIGAGLVVVAAAAALARVVVEGIQDSISHNLWPLAIISHCQYTPTLAENYRFPYVRSLSRWVLPVVFCGMSWSQNFVLLIQSIKRRLTSSG